MAVKKEKIKLIISNRFHKLVQLLLSSHYWRILYFFIILSQFRSRVIDNLSSERYVLLQFINRLSVINVNRKHFELITFTVGNSDIFTIQSVLWLSLILKIKATTNEKHLLLFFRRKIFWELRNFFRKPHHSVVKYPKIIVYVKESKLCPFAIQVMLINISHFANTFLGWNMVNLMGLLLT